jgi:hypothetical protein
MVDFGQPWDRVLWPTLAPDACSAAFCSTFTHAGREVSFFSTCDGEEAILRTAGCFLIWAIPPQGLEEAVESLRDVWTHYARRQIASPTPTARAIVGRKGETVPRSKLSIQTE